MSLKKCYFITDLMTNGQKTKEVRDAFERYGLRSLIGKREDCFYVSATHNMVMYTVNIYENKIESTIESYCAPITVYCGDCLQTAINKLIDILKLQLLKQ